MKQLLAIIFTLFFLSGCASTGEVIREDIQTQVYFCPRDDCSSHLVEALSQAEQSIHCAFYDLDLENVKTALFDMSKKVDVLLLLDNDNAGALTKYYWIRKDKTDKLMHNKFCIIDNKYVWTGSMNPTERCDKVNNNNALLLKSTYLSQNYESEFKEMWYGTFNRGEQVQYPVIGNYQNYFCPEDNCAQHVIETLSKAKNSIRFMTFSFTDDDIGDKLIEKSKEGIEVKGVFEKTQENDYVEYYKLKKADLNVKWDNNTANMHHKVFIVDDNIVIAGSYNPTGNGNSNNDENILIIEDKDIAKKYLEEFSLVFG